MTNKIPVGATIARAYGFAFGNILNNLGMIWVPVAILWALAYFFQTQYLNAIVGMTSGDIVSAMASMRYAFAASIIGFILAAAQIAMLTKEALGLRTGNPFLQFPFGSSTWRLLGAYFLYAIVIVAIYIGCLFGAIFGGIAFAAIVGHSGDKTTMAVTGFAVVALVIAIFCGIIYAAVRLSFFLAPVVVVEKRVSLIRSWELTAGNFWRIFVIGFAIFLPIIVLELILLYATVGSSLFPPVHAHMTSQDIAAFTAHQRELSQHMMFAQQHYWFIYYPAGLIGGLILYGLSSAAPAFAYRALVPEGTAVPDA
jgi:hypothetical protein